MMSLLTILYHKDLLFQKVLWIIVAGVNKIRYLMDIFYLEKYEDTHHLFQRDVEPKEKTKSLF